MFTPAYFAPVLDSAIPVRLAALSFIIPVPAGIGQPMVYPRDIADQPAMRKGSPILNKKGQPKGTGIVFENYADGAVQAARDDGQSVIIINGITRDQGTDLAGFYTSVNPVPGSMTGAQIRQTLDFAHKTLGLKDFFNGDRADVAGFEAVAKFSTDSAAGIFIRRSREERFALAGYGSGTYEGPASSPQTFNGSVVVVTNRRHAWMVQTDAFLATYRQPNDQTITLKELPAFCMLGNAEPVPTYHPIPFVPRSKPVQAGWSK